MSMMYLRENLSDLSLVNCNIGDKAFQAFFVGYFSGQDNNQSSSHQLKLNLSQNLITTKSIEFINSRFLSSTAFSQRSQK